MFAKKEWRIVIQYPDTVFETGMPNKLRVQGPPPIRIGPLLTRRAALREVNKLNRQLSDPNHRQYYEDARARMEKE